MDPSVHNFQMLVPTPVPKSHLRVRRDAHWKNQVGVPWDPLKWLLVSKFGVLWTPVKNDLVQGNPGSQIPIKNKFATEVNLRSSPQETSTPVHNHKRHVSGPELSNVRLTELFLACRWVECRDSIANKELLKFCAVVPHQPSNIHRAISDKCLRFVTLTKKSRPNPCFCFDFEPKVHVFLHKPSLRD